MLNVIYTQKKSINSTSFIIIGKKGPRTYRQNPEPWDPGPRAGPPTIDPKAKFRNPALGRTQDIQPYSRTYKEHLFSSHYWNSIWKFPLKIIYAIFCRKFKAEQDVAFEASKMIFWCKLFFKAASTRYFLSSYKTARPHFSVFKTAWLHFRCWHGYSKGKKITGIVRYCIFLKPGWKKTWLKSTKLILNYTNAKLVSV